LVTFILFVMSAALVLESCQRRRLFRTLEAELGHLRRELAALKPPVPKPMDNTEEVVVPQWIRELPSPAPPPAEPVAAPVRPHRFDWESLVGIKLFSVVAGIALLVATVAFLRYGIDRGWLGAWARLAMGVLLGAGLLAVCETRRAQVYGITAQSLTAAGIAILFSTFYAATARWDLMPSWAGFLLMAAVTAVAVALSLRRDAMVIALLGLVGGFATPMLLSAGQDRPLGLFGYLALLDLGLAWVAYRKRWPLLTALTLAFTVLYQADWVVRFLVEDKLGTGFGVFMLFPALAFGALSLARQEGVELHPLFQWTTALSAVPSVILAMHVAATPEYGAHAGMMFGFLFLVAAGLGAVALLQGPAWLHLVGAAGVLAVFGAHLTCGYTPAAWPGLLGFTALFAGLYLAFPWIQARLPRSEPARAAGLVGMRTAPLLFIVLLVLVHLEPRMAEPGRPFGVLLALVALVAIAALRFRQPTLLLLSTALALAVEAAWTFRFLDASNPLPTLGLFLGFALAGLVWSELGRRRALDVSGAAGAGLLGALVILLLVKEPFLLPTSGPFILVQVLLALGLLTLAWRSGQHGWAVALALSGVLMWPERAAQGRDLLTLAVPVYLIQLGCPLVLGGNAREERHPYLAALVASGVFFLVARPILTTLGYGPQIGLLPIFQALLLVPHLLRLLWLQGPGQRDLGRLALVAGGILAFVTVAIPLQLEKEWVTLGWALLGLALAWLYGRVPHGGLLTWTGGLFAAVFARLVLNPAVLQYHPRSAVLVLNWYLYTYLVAAMACFGAAQLLKGRSRLPRLLTAAGAVLLFLLLNIEIADVFSTGAALTFNLNHGTLAEDLSYTMGWALFALCILVAGIVSRSRMTRVAAILLLTVTVLKAFLHDLARLEGLYRVGAFVGLALSLALVAVILQKFALRRSEA
jgi:hypothetical protein